MNLDAYISSDTQALLMLCTPIALGDGADLRYLTLKEWNALSEKMCQSAWKTPADMMGLNARELADGLQIEEHFASRIAALMDRGGQLGLAMARLRDMGIWVVNREETEYPARLNRRLQQKAPVIFFGAGPAHLLNQDGIAVVGSRETDEAGYEFAKRIGERCAQDQQVVFSGAARGVDRIAMTACLMEGGQSAAVVAESLERMITDRDFRRAVAGESLCLITPYLPSAPFSAGNAMGRNKLIYALANHAIVVDSTAEKGGTWSGALENLSGRWVPLFVRDAPDCSEGNRKLIKRGGIGLSDKELEGEISINSLLKAKCDEKKPARTIAEQGDLLSFVETGQPATPVIGGSDIEPVCAGIAGSDVDPFEAAWPRMEAFLEEPRSWKEVAMAFGLPTKLTKDWMEKNCQGGRLVQVKRRPFTCQTKEGYRKKTGSFL